MTGAIGGTGAAGADGAAVLTSTIGRRTFTVQAEDVAQNARTVRVRYTVVPVCAGELATVYVAGGKIVGGPDSGDAYTGTLRDAGNDTLNGGTGSNRLLGGTGFDTCTPKSSTRRSCEG